MRIGNVSSSPFVLFMCEMADRTPEDIGAHCPRVLPVYLLMEPPN